MQASAAAPQGWFKLPAAPPSCCQPPPVGPPAPAVARQDHKNIGGTPTRSGLQQLRAPPDEACLSVKHLPAITATWQRTSLGKSRPRASRVCPAGQAQAKNAASAGFQSATCSNPASRTLEPWTKPADWTLRRLLVRNQTKKIFKVATNNMYNFLIFSRWQIYFPP